MSIEQSAADLHARLLRPLAEKLAFDLPTWALRNSATPTVLFLGNHSSGKSSFINFLLGQPVQATGLAPTDDGFTILTWGRQRTTADGPTVISHPELELGDLAALGPSFSAKLVLKTLPLDLLGSVTFVDSPGMIDAVGAVNTRGYDFPAAVRAFAERADLILFFFDPDKPGTTAESVSILTQTLAGLDHKLRLVLNKVDQFDSFRDLARTYGTLCWNLAKAIPTKDIPHIATCYLPAPAGNAEAATPERPARRASGIPMDDFDASRTEILDEVKRTPGRRADNLVTELLRRARELLLHARVCREIAREYRRLRIQWIGALALTALLAGVAGWLGWKATELSWSKRAAVIATGVAAVATVTVLGQWQARRFARRSDGNAMLDEAFAAACEGELTLRDRADLRARWQEVRGRTARAVRLLGPGRLALDFGLSRSIARLEKAAAKEIPGLRGGVGGGRPELQLKLESESGMPGA